ncbi:MAG: hypothetical protein KIT84_04145 [Labilithrix sp.]|nr:hypothetical protein [Labilithrix sp.]MCW5810177.1 hypothetical protein [Labilithrix sp.]
MASRFVLLLALSTALAVPALAHADETPAPTAAQASVPEALLTGLAKHASSLEEMKRRGAFTFTGRMEALDGDGHASEVKEITMRSTPTSTPRERIVKVMRYVEDGKDKTAEAQAKADERRAKHRVSKGDKKANDLKLPFLPSEQARYTFSLVERDAANPSRVLIAFTPKVPAEDAFKGTAWVDEKEREVLSTGFSFSKNPTFVDHVHITMVFGLSTPLGRAPSQISFDGKGGFLFIRKHYRGSARITDPAIAF